MDRVKELQKDRDERKAEIKDILAAATKDKRPISDDERAKTEQLQAELERIGATLKLEEEALAWDRDSAPASDRPAGDPAPAAAAPPTPNPWGDCSTQKGTVRAFGAFLSAAMEAGRPGGNVDRRLYAPQAAASGMNTTVPSEGGFLVRSEFSTMLLDRAREASVWAADCSSVEIGEGFDGLEAPYIDETSRATGSRWGGVQVYRRAEADTVTAAKPKLGKFQLNLEDLMGLAYVTGRGRQDASALGQVIADGFASEFAFKLDDEIVRGTGAGQCLGLFPGGAVGTATVSQAAEGGQTAGTIVAANVQKMFARVPSRFSPGAKWYINQEAWPQMFAFNQANMPIFMPGVSLANAPFGTLLGRPIVPTEQSSAIGTVGDIVFAAMSEYVLIRKGGLQADESMHVRFLFDEIAFRFIARVNGAPKWKTTLTKYKGADVISPFVGLAAR